MIETYGLEATIKKPTERRRRKERKCKQWGCKTILSRYNKSRYCAICRARRLRDEIQRIQREEAKKLAKKNKEFKQLTVWCEDVEDIVDMGNNFKEQQIMTMRQPSGNVLFALYVRD